METVQTQSDQSNSLFFDLDPPVSLQPLVLYQPRTVALSFQKPISRAPSSTYYYVSCPRGGTKVASAIYETVSQIHRLHFSTPFALLASFRYKYTSLISVHREIQLGTYSCIAREVDIENITSDGEAPPHITRIFLFDHSFRRGC